MELPISNIGLIKPAALESKELFTKVKSFLKEAFGKDLTVSQHKALGYDINFETQTKAEVHLLEDADSLVSLVFGVATRNDGTSLETARFQTFVDENNETVLKDVNFDLDTKEFVEVASEAVDDAKKAWGKISEKANNGIFEQLKNEPGTVTAQAFGDFCMPGGYQYCGQKCGKNGSAGGGGALLNKIDGCCYNHDYCYSQYSTNRCDNCDKALISCVSNPINYAEDQSTASAIILYFSTKCY